MSDSQTKFDEGFCTLNRRRFLELSGSTALGLLAGSGAFVTSGPAQAGSTNLVLLDVVMNSGKRSYSGKSTGPVIRAEAGDCIDVLLVNELPADDDDCVADHNSFHGNNTTNLHTHGLHVRPDTDSTGAYDADNIFLKVVPMNQDVPCWDDETFRRGIAKYRFELPADHTAGTYWYHAHKHGSTANQVIDGLVGALIIEDPSGFMPEYIAMAPERILMFTANGAVLVDPTGGGEVNPTIELRPGAVERWRIINATAAANSFLHIGIASGDVELWQIAFDGLTLEKRVLVDSDNNQEPWLNHAALAPGNRTDLMVRVDPDATAGTALFAASQAPDEFLHVADQNSVLEFANPVEVTIKIAGEPKDDPWSNDDYLPGPGDGLPPVADAVASRERLVSFERISSGLAIDGEKFDNQVKKKMKLNTVEQWTVQNTTSGTHPFHIHVNPFFVTHINEKELPVGDPLRRWQDTISLPGLQEDGTPGSITFKSRYTDFTGAFVIHCHILFHEDTGMMQKVEVVT